MLKAAAFAKIAPRRFSRRTRTPRCVRSEPIAPATATRHARPALADETDARATGPARTAASSVERPNAVAVTAVRVVRCERPAGSWPGCRHGHWARSRSVPLMVLLFGRWSDPGRRGRRPQGHARMATACDASGGARRVPSPMGGDPWESGRYQWPRCTTSLNGRRLGRWIGVSGRSAGVPRVISKAQNRSSGKPSKRRASCWSWTPA